MLSIEEKVPLAGYTTLELGGPARHFVEAQREEDVVEAIGWAEQHGVPLVVLGGGSNLVVCDAGFDGLVLAARWSGVRYQDDGEHVLVSAAAGEPWDALVEGTVAGNLAGLECLSGIPGLVGATPIQNVGAYGQDVASTITAVRAFDRHQRRIVTLSPAELAFGYRDSALKREPGRMVVLEVTFRLTKGGAPRIAYAELQRAMEGHDPTLAAVRTTVLALRRSKSMVIDASDPNRRSAGSFFTNPIVSEAAADAVLQRALSRGAIEDAQQLPRWAEQGGRIKLAAGWLIERAGIQKGLRQGAVGVSSAHALALVHHGGGKTADLLALARHIEDAVRQTWDVELAREPVLW
jgi:UDP-N-acetylmuramate dehydrogenase